MARLTREQWDSVRAERETGSSFRTLAARFGVSDAAIVKRSKAENWGDGQDVGEAVRRKVSEKVSGIVSAANPKKKAEAIDAAAEVGASVLRQHQSEWRDHRNTFGSVPEHFEAGKLAKISAEMLKIRQAGERLAHGLDTAETAQEIVIARSYAR